MFELHAFATHKTRSKSSTCLEEKKNSSCVTQGTPWAVRSAGSMVGDCTQRYNERCGQLQEGSFFDNGHITVRMQILKSITAALHQLELSALLIYLRLSGFDHA